MREEILRIENVSKSIEGVIYLDNINFHIFKGEIMGLIPLNNHGKDQLVQLISQNISIDFGRIYFDEELVNYYEYSNMTNNRVYIIDKQTKLVEDLNVIDNIYVLNPKFSEYIIRENRIKEKTDELIRELDLNIKTDQLVSELSIFEKTLIEMIKAVLNGAQLILLNEISNFLSVEELYDFQKLIRYYTKWGISFLYMANHHEESFQICDRVCLFENGRVIKVIDKKEFSDEILEPYIIEFDKNIGLNWTEDSIGNFEFKDFFTKNLKGTSFSIKRGKCITILDINNKGIQDIEQILNGELIPKEGKIVLDGREIKEINPNTLLENKIAFIPENPVEKVLFYDMSYMGNLTFLMDYKLDKSIINKKILKNIRIEYRKMAGKDIDEVEIRNLDRRALYNLVYFRILLFNPRVVFIMQPFSNSDMYLRGRIIELINKLKKNGIGVIVLAVSISDTLTVSDRLFIMEDGRISRKYGKEYFLAHRGNIQ